MSQIESATATAKENPQDGLVNEPLWNYPGYAARGLMMGCADVVPGVSGGTVALILGIYDRLIAAISHCDRTFFDHLRRGNFIQAARHIDLMFLISLAVGVGVGIIGMSFAIERLFAVDHLRCYTLATFFGMILATGFLIAKHAELFASRSNQSRLVSIGLLIAGAALSYFLTTLPRGTGEPSSVYLFFSGMIAICAMILPGISGAMILWVLGVYLYVTAIPKDLIKRIDIANNLYLFTVFVSGCLIGLIGFSKILRYLLKHFRQATMAVLCGFVFGALGALWPYRVDATPGEPKIRHKVFEAIWPDPWGSTELVAIAFVIGGILIVAASEIIASRLKPPTTKPS